MTRKGNISIQIQFINTSYEKKEKKKKNSLYLGTCPGYMQCAWAELRWWMVQNIWPGYVTGPEESYTRAIWTHIVLVAYIYIFMNGVWASFYSRKISKYRIKESVYVHIWVYAQDMCSKHAECLLKGSKYLTRGTWCSHLYFYGWRKGRMPNLLVEMDSPF